MVSVCGNVVLSYNGEVYNYESLRVVLESKGHRFRSRTDSEVVLNAWVEWGEECLLRFNGMFAFAVWDKRAQSIFLARDRFGVKPLYYTFQKGSLVFASEQRAIRVHPAVESRVDCEGLLEYFTFQNLLTDRTLLEDVRLLPAGSLASMSIGASSAPQIRQYWDYHFHGGIHEGDSSALVDELDALLEQAVSRQLVTDVELGSYLSGGIDSGTLTALAARELPYIKTFTCGFDLSSASGIELGYDERAKAEAMSAAFKTEHYEMVLKAGDMERCMARLAWHVEEPRVGQSYPNFYVAQLASKFVTVVLSGAGGDELFGGYPWRYYRASDSKNFDDYVDKYYAYWQRLVSNKELRRLFAPIWGRVKSVWTRDIFEDVFKTHENQLETPSDYINHSLYFEARTFLHGLFLVEDKLSMAHSLETRVPFMDNDLVDFALRCPVNLKLRDLTTPPDRINENVQGGKQDRYFLKTRDGKAILRETMARHLPSAIASAPKKGFSAPDGSWFKGESIEFVKRVLFSRSARIYDYLDRQVVEEMVGEHLSGAKNRRLLIWSLISVEAWLASLSSDTGSFRL